MEERKEQVDPNAWTRSLHPNCLIFLLCQTKLLSLNEVLYNQMQKQIKKSIGYWAMDKGSRQTLDPKTITIPAQKKKKRQSQLKTQYMESNIKTCNSNFFR